MARIKIRYFVEKTGRNGPRHFWQPAKALAEKGWKLVRLADDRQTAIAEAEARNQALDDWRDGTPTAAAPDQPKRRGPAVGTVDELIAAYRASRFYTALRASTKEMYDWNLDILSEWAGPEPARAITPPRVQKLYEPMQKVTPAKANGVMRVGRLLWSRGRLLGKVGANPFEKAGLIGLDKTGKVWPREAVAIFVETADAMQRWSIGTAVMLDEWLGQRQNEVLNLPRTIMRGGSLVLRQSKTGAGVDLPIGMVQPLVRRVQDELARQEARKIQATRLLISEINGQPWNRDSFRHEFAAIRLEAAKRCPVFECDYAVAGRDPDAADAYQVRMDELWFMHLRHTAVVRLAEAGCDAPLISAITGHTLSTVERILETYLIRTGEMARQAFAKRLEHERRQKGGQA